MVNRLKKSFFFILFPLLLFTNVYAASEDTLVGILPFTNQRAGGKSDWLGYFARARIEANLRRNSDWKFHNLRTLHFWKVFPDVSPPETDSNSIIIFGSFQQVIDIGVMVVTVRLPGDEREKQVRFQFTISELGEKLDSVSQSIGRWIDSEYKQDTRVTSSASDEIYRDFYTLLSQTYEMDRFPETRLMIHLMEVIDEKSPVDMIAGLAETMLIFSERLNQKERETIYGRVESLLQKTIQIHRGHSDLYALLAETYYLKQSYTEWVDKTAKEALAIDDRNDLACILILLTSDLEERDIKRFADLLTDINPILWNSLTHRRDIYQKGLLGNDLFALGKRLKKL